MTLEENITAILETHFSGFKDELIEACAKRIMKQIERQAYTPQTDCDKCIWNVCNYNKVDWEADTPQTDCPYREYPCDMCDEQTDCQWK